MARDDMRARLLGTHHGARARESKAVSLREGACREALAELIALERRIDAETTKHRAEDAVTRQGRGRHGTPQHRAWRLPVPLLAVAAAGVCVLLLFLVLWLR
ncbi:MAG: hypothetical protein ACXV4A_14200 [Actinomycetes bacterium]